MGKCISNMDMKYVTCPKCGRTVQKCITTMSELVCPHDNCRYKFDAFVRGDFVMYYNPNDGESKELASVLIESERFPDMIG